MIEIGRWLSTHGSTHARSLITTAHVTHGSLTDPRSEHPRKHPRHPRRHPPTFPPPFKGGKPWVLRENAKENERPDPPPSNINNPSVADDPRVEARGVGWGLALLIVTVVMFGCCAAGTVLVWRLLDDAGVLP